MITINNGATTVLRGYIDGLTLSTAGSSATFSVSAGMAADSTNAVLIQLAASISKTTSAWAVGSGNGALDTGAIANSTWYHVYLIRRSDTGVVDVLISLSATTPTMPANYDAKRRIGAMKTNGSAQWTLFVQIGDTFYWNAVVQDVNTNNPGTAAILATLSVPTGVNVQAVFTMGVTTNNSLSILVSSPLASDQAVSFSSAISFVVLAGTGNTGTMLLYLITDTSARVRYRLNLSDANVTAFVNTAGWVDFRGKNS